MISKKVVFQMTSEKESCRQMFVLNWREKNSA